MNYYLPWFSLRGPLVADLRNDVWKEALNYLKRTRDVDGWWVMLYGA